MATHGNELQLYRPQLLLPAHDTGNTEASTGIRFAEQDRREDGRSSQIGLE